ncbi:L-histidine N(alpha)-methyltransferase [Polyangium sp. 6x1]|uniref:L-histidine N(alpha)-methyltransferase n=1 Tax=Polyangium sp. 6x1 TaxID=3042689 RepID=UPI002482E925|nr:L-histidine N(alpha)-methyltransferase [Polyangium sp. 6x1]MDI1446422.1 L-histidine N(alpha)-methyltransferase [Polyangium sp. 6x1]
MDGSPLRKDAPEDLAPRSSTRPIDEGAALRASLLQELPEIPARYLYDDTGSELFERITGLSVYYQTRTEISILESRAADIVAHAHPRQLVELGSGAGRKIRILLDSLRADGRGVTCTMLDINELFLLQSIDRLSVDYPEFAFRGVVGNFMTDLGRLGPAGGRLVVFFAGTVGNLHPDERRSFFGELSQRMDDSDALLLGVDLVKDPARLEAAYDDPEGVTAAFNLNILSVLNRRFAGDFDPSAFRHRAFYDPENAWIEMRLVAKRKQDVRLGAIDLELALDAGAEIRTELSCKFTRASLEASAAAANLTIDRWYTDPDDLFALALLRRRRP